MARQVKNADKWHTFTMHQPIAGRTATLRKLAYAILKEVGPSVPVEEGAAE